MASAAAAAASPTARTSRSMTATTPSGDLKYRNPYQASLDGNTVEMPVEQAAFSENNVRYQASLQFHQFRRSRSCSSRSTASSSSRREHVSIQRIQYRRQRAERRNDSAQHHGQQSRQRRERQRRSEQGLPRAASGVPNDDGHVRCRVSTARTPRVGVRVLGVVESTAPPLMRYQPDNPLGEQGRLRLQLERQFDRRDDQHDLGEPLLRDQRRGDQHGARSAAQNHFDGPLGTRNAPC